MNSHNNYDGKFFKKSNFYSSIQLASINNVEMKVLENNHNAYPGNDICLYASSLLETRRSRKVKIWTTSGHPFDMA